MNPKIKHPSLLLNTALVAIDNSMNVSEIAKIVETAGYSMTVLQEGKTCDETQKT